MRWELTVVANSITRVCTRTIVPQTGVGSSHAHSLCQVRDRHKLAANIGCALRFANDALP